MKTTPHGSRRAARLGFRLAAAAAAALLAALAGCHDAEPVTLIFAGDVMLGRVIERQMRTHRDWEFPFRYVADRLRRADVAFVNLECLVTTAAPHVRFRADPETLNSLSMAGIDVVSVANNHTLDAGNRALAEMLGHLRARDISPIGALERVDRQRPVVLRPRGLRVAYLAYGFSGVDRAPAAGAATARLNMERIAGDVAAVRPSVDYLVVALHMGVSAPRATAPQRLLAHATIDAGADLVVGGHPHRPQEVEKYGRGFIAYSLGDFVFDHPGVSTDGAILTVTLAAGRPVRLSLLPTRMNAAFQPQPGEEQVWEAADLDGRDRVLQ